MESTESETAAQRSTEKETSIRFIVPNALAGSVIGRGGSTITRLQDHTGAQIRVSRNGDYFPGTTCRIVVVSGTTEQVVSAVALVLGKLQDEQPKAEDGSDAELGRTRIVVPHTFCGGIIGRGGATIRSFIEESKAGIKISPMDITYLGLRDRLVTLRGTMEEQMRAISLILTKLTEDDDYSHQVHSPNVLCRHDLCFFDCDLCVFRKFQDKTRVIFGNRQNSPSNHLPRGNSAKSHSALERTFYSVTIGVSDKHIGVVLGRGGRRVMRTSEISGARIKISVRGVFLPGTTDRKVTISGFQGSITRAVGMIQDQVESALKRAN